MGFLLLFFLDCFINICFVYFPSMPIAFFNTSNASCVSFNSFFNLAISLASSLEKLPDPRDSILLPFYLHPYQFMNCTVCNTKSLAIETLDSYRMMVSIIYNSLFKFIIKYWFCHSLFSISFFYL